MKLLFRLFLALIVVIVGAAVAIPFLLPSGWIAAQVAEQVRTHTGRTLTFSDDTSLSVYPDISLVLKNAKLSNPSDMPPGFVVAMETLRLKVALQPLFARKVEIQEFQLERPVANLLVTGDGKSNWQFANVSGGSELGSGQANETIESFKLTEFALGPITIRNGRLHYLDERSGTAMKLDAVNTEISLPKIDGAIAVKGDLVWKGERIDLNFRADKPKALTEDKPSKISIAITSKLVGFNFSGSLSLAGGVRLNGGINVKTPSLRRLSSWTGSPLAPGKGLEAFSIKSPLAYGNDTINLKNARIALDGMNVQGDVSVVTKGAVPRITARVGVDKVNVNSYMPGNASGGGGSAASGKWSTAPIDMSGLRAVNADISLNAGQIIYKKTVISNASTRLKLNAGTLDAAASKMSLYGGSAAGALRLSGARKVPTISGSLRTQDVDANRFLKDFAGFDWLEGATAITTQVSSAGRNQAQLVSNLGGTFKISLWNGAIRGYNIAKMVRGATKNILDGWKKEPTEKTDFSVLAASFKIRKGLARNDDLKLIGPLVRVTGSGQVLLPAKTLNYTVKPKVVASLKGQGGTEDLSGLTVPFKIKGPWSNLQIYPDMKGILENPDQAFSAINKLLKGKSGLKGLSTKTLTKKIEKKTIKKVTKELNKVIGEKNSQELEDLGRNFLDGLFKKKN